MMATPNSTERAMSASSSSVRVTGPLQLGCTIGNETAVLVHNGAPCSEMTFVLDDDTSVEIDDFVYDQKHCRINAFTIERNGALTPWPRSASDGGCADIVLSGEQKDADILIVPVAYAAVGALTDDGLDAFQSRAYLPSRVRVQLPDPKDDRPFP